MASTDQQELPTVDLPTYDGTPPSPPVQQMPSGRLRVQMGGGYADRPVTAPPTDAPLSPTAGAPSISDFLSDEPPPKPAGQPAGAANAQPAPQEHGGIESMLSDAPPEQPAAKEKPQVGGAESALRGVGNALTFGFDPAVAGAAAVLHDYFSEHPNADIAKVYNEARQNWYDRNEAASEQHFVPYLAGQLAGSLLAVPLGAAGIARAGVGTGARVLRSIGTGASTAGLYGAGDTISSGDTDLAHVALNAAKQGATGAVLGGATGAGAEAVGAVGKKVAGLVRGKMNPEQEAAKRVVENSSKDFADTGFPVGKEEIAAGNAAGTPRYIVDTGGENTRGLLRSAANASPSARNKMDEKLQHRFWEQGERIGGWLRGKIGGTNAADMAEALRNAAAKANKPLYQRAYARGARGLWSPEIERIAGAPAIGEAAKAAARRGGNRAVLSGFGAFNPKVTFKNGILTIQKKGGVPTHPDLQFWDYVQRELADAADKAFRSGAKEEGGAISGLRKQLVAELDKIVPEFADARGTAARFFGATDALEAGRLFVRGGQNIDEAARVLHSMSTPERQLFKVGFASELADTVERVRDKVSVVNSAFVNSAGARRKIVMALGNQDARELEALLRIESIVDKARQALGNSSTVRQLGETGLAGAGAVGAYEGLKEGDFNPVHIIGGAILLGSIRHGAHKIDNKVAEHVAELLMSSNPKAIASGYKIATKNPIIFDALRVASNASATQLAEHLGFSNVMAGAATAAQNIRHLGEGHEAHHHDHGNQLIDQQVDQNQ